MRLLRMHSSVRNQPKQVKPALSGARMFHRLEQHRMREEFAILDHQIDARDVHVHNASRADVKMPDLAISHLPFGQSDESAAGMKQGVGVLAKQAVVRRFTRQRDGIGFGFGAISPAIENDQNERFRTRHKQLLAPSFWFLGWYKFALTPADE